MLNEGISHLEDLDLQDFIAIIKNISQLQASEKLDGAQLWFGIDEDGRLFTSRAGKRKNAENIYSEADYPYLSAYNGFRAAHAALQQKEADIKKILRPGQTVEIEVLYGRQPNAVVYGAGNKNYIAFLRAVDDTPAGVVDQLESALGNAIAKVRVKVVDTPDGVNLTLTPTEVEFQFVGVQKIDTQKLKTVDLNKKIEDLEKFLGQKIKIGDIETTHFQVLTDSLSQFPVSIRPEVKRIRTDLQSKVLTGFKLPIKRELLDKFVGQIKSPLAAPDLTPDEDIGIEGVVLTRPGSAEMVKLVDKDAFTTINQFNHSARAALSGVVKTTDMGAAPESRGGIIGEMKILIADFLGNRELARGAAVKKVLASFAGKTPEDTIRQAAKQLAPSSDVIGIKKKVAALIEAAQQKVASSLKTFVSNKDTYRLKLKSGREIGLSPEVVRRTLLAHAEAKRDLDELKQKINAAKSIAQVYAVMYGKAAKALHSADAVTEGLLSEGLLLEKRLWTDKAQYKNKDGWTILNIYFATIMMAVIIYKEHDKPGMRILRDKSNYRLRGWAVDMSPVNFWGYPIWRSGTPVVKKLIGAKVAAEIFKHSRKVVKGMWLYTHLDLSSGKDVPIEYEDILKVLRLLQHFPGMYMDRINMLLKPTFGYEQLTRDEKIKFHNALYYYAMQFIPSSPLLYRMRAIYDALLGAPTDEASKLVVEMKLLRSIALAEEGEGGGNGAGATAATAATGAASATASATTASAVAPIEQRIFGKKAVIRRQRNQDWPRMDKRDRWKIVRKEK